MNPVKAYLRWAMSGPVHFVCALALAAVVVAFIFDRTNQCGEPVRTETAAGAVDGWNGEDAELRLGRAHRCDIGNSKQAVENRARQVADLLPNSDGGNQ